MSAETASDPDRVEPAAAAAVPVEDCSNEASSSDQDPELTHRWTLSQFSKYLPGEKVLSEPFLFNGQQWRIMAFPRGNNGNAAAQAGALIGAAQVATNTHAEAAVKTKLTVLREGAEGITKSFCRGFCMRAQHRDWGFKKMCLVAELQADGWPVRPAAVRAPAGRYITDDSLQIELSLWQLKGATLEQTLKTRHTSVNKEFIIESIAGNNVGASLDLTGQALTPEFAVSLGKSLHSNTSITKLNLANNKIGPKGTTAVMAALLNNSTLQELCMRGCSLGPAGAMQLTQALVANPALSVLHIGANSLEPKGGTLLGGMLACNSSLTELSVDSNKLGVAGVDALLKGVQGNTSLRLLDLCDNELDKTIGPQLRETLEADNALTQLGLAKNSLGSGVDEVLQTLQSASARLHTLDISCCSLGSEKPDVLAETLAKTSCLTTVNIAGNGLGLDGSSAVLRSLCTNTTVVRLNMNNNGMGGDIGATIKKMLKLNKTLQELHLAWNDLGHVGGIAVAKGLKINGALTHLDLSHNCLGAASGASLEQALLANTSLKNLCLRGNQLEAKAGTGILNALGKPGFHLSLLNSTLETLDISDNNLGKAAGAAVRGLLITNSALTSLNLSCNNIGAAGARCWEEDHLPSTFQALDANHTLTHLNISANSLGADGDKAVYGLLKYSVALKELVVGNNEFGQDATLGILHALMATLHSDVVIKDLEEDIEILEPSDLKLFGLPQQQAADVVMEHIYYKRRKAQQAAQEASEQHAEQQLRALQEADKNAEEQAAQLLQELEAEQETAAAAKKRRRDKKKKKKQIKKSKAEEGEDEDDGDDEANDEDAAKEGNGVGVAAEAEEDEGGHVEEPLSNGHSNHDEETHNDAGMGLQADVEGNSSSTGSDGMRSETPEPSYDATEEADGSASSVTAGDQFSGEMPEYDDSDTWPSSKPRMQQSDDDDCGAAESSHSNSIPNGESSMPSLPSVQKSASWATVANSGEQPGECSDQGSEQVAQLKLSVQQLRQTVQQLNDQNNQLQADLVEQQAVHQQQQAAEARIHELEEKLGTQTAETSELVAQAERAKEMERTVLQMAAKITQMERAGGQLLQEKQRLLLQLEQWQGKQLSSLSDAQVVQLEHQLRESMEAAQAENIERRIQRRANELAQAMVAQHQKADGAQAGMNGPNKGALDNSRSTSLHPSLQAGSADMFGGELVEEMFWDSSWDSYGGWPASGIWSRQASLEHLCT